ncbi:hypothetical protein RRG08_033208 [Elysia crispata]|uniref:Uncharacterized protein n=1 Tax=Elysia crispata TaxID=231223 RepID=A0AAE1BAP9_9GAST|nr:hypothetical protein RRG08_033208 [Elysia crispata]
MFRVTSSSNGFVLLRCLQAYSGALVFSYSGGLTSIIPSHSQRRRSRMSSTSAEYFEKLHDAWHGKYHLSLFAQSQLSVLIARRPVDHPGQDTLRTSGFRQVTRMWTNQNNKLSSRDLRQRLIVVMIIVVAL